MLWTVLAIAALGPATGAPPGGPPDVPVDSTAALTAKARRAPPGTRIVLTAPRYEAPCRITGVRGKPGAMVRIVAADPKRPPVFAGGDVALQLSDCRYVSVEHVVAEKARINNVQVGDRSDHVVLRSVVSRDLAGRSNCDGIKMPDLTDFLVYGCTVADWGGEGSAVDMVGCARGLFVNCRFTCPRPRGVTANCIQPKGGTFDVGVYRCRFDDASWRAVQFGGATGRRYFFRGNYERGFEAYNVVAMGNVIRGGGAACAFVSCTRCTFAYNTIVDPTQYVCRILKEGGTKPTADNTFRRNLIVHDRLTQVLNHGPNVDLKSFRFAENYWYSRVGPSRSIPTLPVVQKKPAGGEDPRLDEDLRPAAEAAKAYGAHAPGLAEAWAEHTGRFEWAWQQAQKLEKADERKK